MSGLQGQRVIILGGSSGIGLATAQAAAASGAHVTIASRSAERLASALATLGHRAASQVLDVTQDAAVEAFFAQGAWDHLVISASQTRTGGARALPMADAYAAMNSKFWGAYRACRAAQLREDGSITLVGGGLALELAPVRVNTVAPGLIDTPLLARQGEELRQQRLAHAKSTLPLRRAGTAADVAEAILYLMNSRFSTGTTLVLDGGAAII